MFVSENLRALIRAKLADGRLLHDSIRVSGGPGNGETCVACDELITKANLVMQGVGAGLRVVQFHVQCFYVWDTERDAPGGRDGTAAAR
jgi:hypothetical protein